MSQYPDAFMVHLQLCNKMKGDYFTIAYCFGCCAVPQMLPLGTKCRFWIFSESIRQQYLLILKLVPGGVEGLFHR